MPSALPLVTVADLRNAFHDAIRGRKDKRSDRVSGSIYDLIGGTSALILSRECQRDKDLFGADYLDNAVGDDLTSRGLARYDIPRVLDAYGTGIATVARPTAVGGAGTIWEGSRIIVAGGDKLVYYAVAADMPVSSTATQLTLPVRATTYGPAPAITQFAPVPSTQFDDELFDNTFTVQTIVVGPGTTFEDATTYRARIRQTLLQNRVGYEDKIIQAAQAAGAAYVALFRSDVGSPDCGLNACFVGDAGYSASTALLRAVLVQLESVRVLGADLFVRAMSRQALTVNAAIHLRDNPGKFDLVTLTEEFSAALCAEFIGASSGFAYKLDSLAGAMGERSDALQSVVWNTPSQDQNILVNAPGDPPKFPHVLTRYTLRPQDIVFNFLPPE